MMKYIFQWFLIALAGMWACAAYAQEDVLPDDAPLETLEIEAAEGDSSAITIRDTAPIHLNHTGILSSRELGLPPRLWENIPAESLREWLTDIPAKPGSTALRQWLLKAIIVADPSWPEDEALFELRVKTLIRLGYADLALELLQDVPKGLVKPDQDKLSYSLHMLAGKAGDSFCNDVVSKLAETADVFWQRWVVLCQLQDKKTEKASLGLQLLEEQNAASDFFQKLVKAVQEGKAFEYKQEVPAALTLEQISWLIFTKQDALLWSQTEPSLEVVGLLNLHDSRKTAELWPAQQALVKSGASAKGPFRASLPTMLQEGAVLPKIYGDLNEAELAKYFYTIVIRDALGLENPAYWADVLAGKSYNQAYHVLYPRWYQDLLTSYEEKPKGEMIIRLSELFDQPLQSYHPRDIARLITLLSIESFEDVAHAVAEELFSELK